MKQPLFDVEERIDRIVGRRTNAPDALSVKTSKKADALAWQKAFGGLRVPRGVYRFRAHEEADDLTPEFDLTSREPTMWDLEPIS